MKFNIFTINSEYLDRKLYHSGVYCSIDNTVMIVPSVWISTFSNLNTGRLYSKKICLFINWLYEYERNLDKIINFWSWITEDTIVAWKVSRLEKRFLDKASRPKDKTIDDDGNILIRFLIWVRDEMGMSIIAKVKNVSSAHFLRNDRSFLSGIVSSKIKLTKNYSDLSVHGGSFPCDYVEVHSDYIQCKGHQYLTNAQIAKFINCFPDKVWKYISLTSLLTGLRAHEVLSVPRFAQYKYSFFTSIPEQIKELIDRGQRVQELHVLGKGKKFRKVEVPLEPWLLIMIEYEELYLSRLKIYEEMEGAPPGLHLLWFGNRGQSRYCDPRDELDFQKATSSLTSAVWRVAERDYKISEEFGFHVDFSCFRHTFATNYLLSVLRKRREEYLLDPNSTPCPTIESFLSDKWLEKRLADLLGHSSFKTTWESYVHNVFMLEGKNIELFPDIGMILNMENF